MNVWTWVEKASQRAAARGDHRLAGLYWNVIDDVSELRFDRVDAGVSEALGLLGDDPWSEVYFRHWQLQSRVFHRAEGAVALADCLRLVELAHRDENRACPQSVCAVQDLAACYAVTDGPGYVEERLAVARETLARIDPTWSCFTCIAGEYASALKDAGRHAEMVAWVDAKVEEQRRAGEPPRRWEFGVGALSGALVALGRADEALAVLDEAEGHGEHGLSERLGRKVARARALAALDRMADAAAALPSPQALADAPEEYSAVAEVWSTLVDAGELPADAELQDRLARMAMRLDRNGAWSLADTVWAVGVRVACRRGRVALAQVHLDAWRRTVAHLRRPASRAQALEALTRLIADTRPTPAEPGTWDAAFEAAPEGAPRAHLLRLAGFLPAARAEVDQRLAVAPGDLPALVVRADVALDSNDEDLLAATVQALDAQGATATARYFEALGHRRRGDLDRCLEACRAVVAIDPRAPRTLRLWAEVAQEQGDWATAAEKWHAVGELDAQDRWPAWALLPPATLAGRWDLVREGWRRATGMELPGEGPVSFPGPHVRVRRPGEGAVWARRDGPATATVVQVCPPGPEHRYGERVVFVPAPEPAEDAQERPVYPEVAVLEPSPFRVVAVDGAHPGADTIAALAEALAPLGVELHDLSADDYRLGGPDGEVPGLYALLEVPHPVADAAVHAALCAWAGDRPVVWPALAAAVGDAAAAERHAELIERWGIRV